MAKNHPGQRETLALKNEWLDSYLIGSTKLGLQCVLRFNFRLVTVY